MMEHTGQLKGSEAKIAIVISRFNERITKALLKGALHTLEKHGVSQEQINIYWVPGAWELPLIAKTVADKGTIDAVLCLGAVIKGETPHFDFVAQETAAGITRTSLDTGIPIIAGVLTTDTAKQAEERSGIRGRNKGSDCAEAALEMIDLLKQIKRKENKKQSFEKSPI